MPKCIVMNIEFPKNKIFEVCVNGEKFTGETDIEIDLKEMFIHALENAVIETMVPDPSKIVKLGEIYKIPKREPRYRVIRLEKKSEEQSIEPHEEDNSPPENANEAQVVHETKREVPKPRGNPNWRKKHAEPEFNTIRNQTLVDETVV